MSKPVGSRVPTDLSTPDLDLDPAPVSFSGAHRILQALNVGVIVFDPEQNLRYANAEHARLLGIDLARSGSMEDWLRAACRDASYAEQVIRSWREHLWQKQLTRVFSLKNANDQLREIEFRPRLLEDGDLLLTLLDVTDSRHAKDALRISETRFDAVFQGVASGLALVDRTGRFLDVNPAFQALTGYSRAELRRMALNDCIAFSDIERLREAEIGLINAAKEPAEEEGPLADSTLLNQCEFTGEDAIRLRPREGEIFPAAVTLSLVLGPQEQPLFTLISVHNEAETGRLYVQSQARNRALLEAIPDLILVLDAKGIVQDMIPPNGGGWRGETPSSAWIGQSITDCWPVFDKASVKRVRESIETTEIRAWRLAEPDADATIHQSVRAAAADEETAVVVVMDASDEAEAREVIARQSVAFRHLEEGIILTNLRGHLEDWNDAAERSFGYRLDEVVGQGIGRLYAAPGEIDALNQEISRALTEKGRWQTERPFYRKDGSVGRAELWFLPVEEAGRPRSLLGIHREIEARSVDSDEAEQMQHRWRNQVQAIGSLLNLEQEAIAKQPAGTTTTREIVLKVQCRLKAASRLHDWVNRVSDPVPLTDYIQTLSEDLKRIVSGRLEGDQDEAPPSFTVRPAGTDDQNEATLTGFETAFAFGLLFTELAVPVLQWRSTPDSPEEAGGQMVIGIYGGHPMMRASVPSAAMRSIPVPVLKVLTQQLRGNLQVRHAAGRAGWTLRFPAGR